MTLSELERHYPGIPWREPISVRSFDRDHAGDVDVLACRVCVATVGLRAAEVLAAAHAGLPLPDGTFADHAGWERHFAEAHA